MLARFTTLIVPEGYFNYFTNDMISNQIEINRLDNQILVRYFDEEWGKL